ncbi:protein phosphatase 1 regulatory subunit 37 [Pangasianodon hypophthalmus]|uniref:protein phosphatase 1 regulatory subunit 37 n=1 Tax=Pangasianodon hypophthalmus TaxID=310915 RepID=UPI00230737E1|nr:protein phosphatase 1 regulatory subunit 37 [Pangasianodon hypophthalmus]
MTMSGHAEEEEVARLLGRKSRGEKRVSFPPDEEMVSGFAESKDARQDGDSRTLTDIILAYEQSCIKHKVAPDPKTLDQIKEITCLSNRARCLDLQGVRLDYRSCESLEEILKSVRFNLINLQGAELEENGASSLMDMISYYESATHLDVSSNTSMGVSGWQALSRLLIQSGCLWRLDACNIPIEDYPAQALSRALLSSRLTVLHLENTGLSGKPLFTLVCSLKKNIALQELYLCDNELNSFHDSMQLGELLKYNRTLRTLDLSDNAISDSGLEELCDGLRVQKSGLRTLVLHNNQITHRGMTHLESVLPLLRTLEALDLSDNNLEDRGMHTLKEALISNRSITQLSLASVGITCEGAVVLAEFLAESRFLQTLDVRQNLVLTGGLMAFALALKLNRTLVHLDLDQNPKEEKDEFLIETQKNLLSRISDLCAANAAAASETDRRSATLLTRDNDDGKDNDGEAAAPQVPTQTLASVEEQ